MRVLAINLETKAKIAAAIAKARKTPVTLDTIRALAAPDKTTITLADRPPGFTKPSSIGVLIPFGYQAAISFEEQPAGLARHLSISVDTPGAYPNEPAVEMIAKELGIDCGENFDNVGRMWLEEFDPGHFAVNLLAVLDDDQPERQLQ